MAITKLNSLAIPPDTIVESDLSYPLTNFSSTGIDDNATSTAITIDSSQNVGFGVTDPDEKLEISGGDLKVDTNGSAGVIHFGPTSDLTKIIGRDTGDPNHPNTLDFYVNSATVSRLNERNASFGGGFTINSSVDTAYATMIGSAYGALVSGDNGGRGLFGTNVTTTNANVPVIANSHASYGGIGLDCSWGVAKIVRKGGSVTAGDTLDTVVRFDNDGLKFGSDTAAANALDDYEEGTWTPTYTTSNSNASVTYNVQTGHYTKIGRCVFITMYLQVSSVSSIGTGNPRFAGLPFTGSGSNERLAIQTYLVDWDSATWPSDPMAYSNNGNSYFRVILWRDNGTWTEPQTSQFAVDTANAVVNISGFYFTNQ